MSATHTSENEGPRMLDFSGIQFSYGRSQVLFGIDLAIREGEVVTMLCRNGMGKTTAVRCIMGLLRLKAGSAKFDGKRIDHQPSYTICQKGIVLVAEGRQIFPNLTVRENLICNGVARNEGEVRWTLKGALYSFLDWRSG